MDRNNRFRLWIILVFGVAGVCFLVRRAADVPSAPPETPASIPAEAKVARVFDGDSFITSGGHGVRLIGIDAPEYGQPFSADAKARLEELVAGRRVLLGYDQEKKDRYGRLLCHVRVDGLWVNRLLVREGLACVYLVRPNVAAMSDLIAAQQAARLEKIGIWSLPVLIPEDYYIRSLKSFRFHRPGCKFARNISSRNAQRLPTRGRAFDEGLSPCRKCRP